MQNHRKYHYPFPFCSSIHYTQFHLNTHNDPCQYKPFHSKQIHVTLQQFTHFDQHHVSCRVPHCSIKLKSEKEKITIHMINNTSPRRSHKMWYTSTDFQHQNQPRWTCQSCWKVCLSPAIDLIPKRLDIFVYQFFSLSQPRKPTNTLIPERVN